MNHENEWLYGFAASLKERITILKDAFPADRNLTALKKWRRRKSLLSDSDFSNMLRTLNISMEDYDLAVSDLTERKLKMLYSHVRKQKWYQIHKSLFTKNIQDNRMIWKQRYAFTQNTMFIRFKIIFLNIHSFSQIRPFWPFEII